MDKAPFHPADSGHLSITQTVKGFLVDSRLAVPGERKDGPE